MDNAVKNDGSDGPWGGRGDGGDGGEGPRQPWGQPRRRPGERSSAGPSAIEALVRRSRERFGGHLPEPGGRPLWLWAGAIFLLLWLALTSVHRIDPSERGVVSRFGRYTATLDPGLRLTLPAPIDVVLKLPVEDVRTVDVGLGDQRAEDAMLTSDRNIVDLAYSVRWKIRDPELYAFGLAHPQDTIKEVAESAMRGEVAKTPLETVMGPERNDIGETVRARTQELLDSYSAGVTILDVTIRRVDPPTEVADAFKDVSKAQQDVRAAINAAQSNAQALTTKAQGDIAEFNSDYAQYRAAPQVTRDRMYYDTMDTVMSRNDKVIVDAQGVTLPLSAIRHRSPQDQGGTGVVETKP